VTVNSSINNNNLFFTNGISGPISAVVDENGSALLNAPSGTYFATVNFASYGNPTGSAPNFTFGACHATTSQSIAENALLGNSTATLRATNGTFGDPCVGTFKRLYILASYVQPICNGATVSISGSTPSGGSGTYAYQWQSSITSATAGFTTAAGTSTGINYISGAITRDTWFRRIATSCSTSNTSFVVLVKVNTAIPVPIITATTQPNCVTATGRVTLGSLPSSGSWTITANPATAGLTGLTGTGLTTIITGLAANTSYTFAVSNGTCSSLSSASAVINPVITTTYTGSTWSTPPTIDMLGVINSNTPINTNIELCNCIVNSGVIATVASGITLKLQDRLTVNGTLTFENNASLVQINNVANSGNITYKRITGTAVRVTDYTYWSSPVTPLNLAGGSGIIYNPSTHVGSTFFSFANNVTSGDWQSEIASKQMEIGKGYIIRGPNTIPSTPLTLLEATFRGVPNNGNITLAGGIIANRSYLIGNPYPSAIDADKFLNVNSSVLGGTLYFWTHRTEIGIGVSNPGTGFFAYSSDDYATYNLTGGVGTVANSDPDKSGANSARPTGKIGAGQGFFAGTVLSPTGSTIVFNNDMRTGLNGAQLSNSQFFRTSKLNSKTTTGVEKNRIWLNLTNSGGAFKQMLVGYITGATNEYDSSYDGSSYSANQYIDFYSVLNSNVLTIQGRALPFDSSDLVPLGYVSTLPGEFSIAIDEVDGVLKSQEVFIEDKMLDIVHDLKVTPYKFNTAIGTFNDRFVLRYTSRTLSNENFDLADRSIIVSKDKNELKVKSQIETIQRITIFNLLGKKVLDQNGINSTEFRSSNSNLTNQTAIVKITLTSGIVISKKVAF